ncbi:unnamed protein product [Chrysoparadoxa australica]
MPEVWRGAALVFLAHICPLVALMPHLRFSLAASTAPATGGGFPLPQRDLFLYSAVQLALLTAVIWVEMYRRMKRLKMRRFILWLALQLCMCLVEDLFWLGVVSPAVEKLLFSGPLLLSWRARYMLSFLRLLFLVSWMRAVIIGRGLLIALWPVIQGTQIYTRCSVLWCSLFGMFLGPRHFQAFFQPGRHQRHEEVY